MTICAYYRFFPFSSLTPPFPTSEWSKNSRLVLRYTKVCGCMSKNISFDIDLWQFSGNLTKHVLLHCWLAPPLQLMHSLKPLPSNNRHFSSFFARLPITTSDFQLFALPWLCFPPHLSCRGSLCIFWIIPFVRTNGPPVKTENSSSLTAARSLFSSLCRLHRTIARYLHSFLHFTNRTSAELLYSFPHLFTTPHHTLSRPPPTIN